MTRKGRISRVTHNLTYVPIHITLRFKEAEMGVGTAFFYTADHKDYLITNWHNVSGRQPWDKQVISKNAAIPDNLVVRIPYEVQREDGIKAYKWVPNVLKLYEDDEHHRPIWWEHPDHGFTIDAVAIEMAELDTTKVVPANAKSLDLDKLPLTPGMDVFVLGYPRGISGGGRFPIWKRGTIVSEPDIHIDNLPKVHRYGNPGRDVRRPRICSRIWVLGTGRKETSRGRGFREGPSLHRNIFGASWKRSIFC